MKIKLVSALVLVSSISGAAIGLTAQSGDYGKYLTVPDIEKASGLSGLKLVHREPRKGAGGNLNFARSDGQLVLIAVFYDKTLFSQYAGEPAMVKSQVPGVGDEALLGPKQYPPYFLVFRKGDKSVALSTFMDPGSPSRTILSTDQLIVLGKVVEGRL